MTNKSIIPSRVFCKVCGKMCKRHSIATRYVKDISFNVAVKIRVKVGVYRCPICKKFFRLQPDFCVKGRQYTKRAMEKVYQSVAEDKTTFTALPQRLQRDFAVSPSKSTCYYWFHSQAKALSLKKDYELWAAKRFSGFLAVDEIFDGDYCIFFATDPLNKITLSFKICKNATEDNLRIFLNHLKNLGINPTIIVRDGKNIYKNVPNEIWPGIKYQLCIFHAIKNINKTLLKSVLTYVRSLEPLPTRDQLKRGRVKLTQEQQDRKFIWEYRFIFVTRIENLSRKQKDILCDLCERHPRLKELKRFSLDIYELFRKHARGSVGALEELSKLERIYHRSFKNEFRFLNKNKSEFFTYHDYKNIDSTSNHVERTNRWFRKRQKGHYRNRKVWAIKNMLVADLVQCKNKTDDLNNVVEKRTDILFTTRKSIVVSPYKFKDKSIYVGALMLLSKVRPEILTTHEITYYLIKGGKKIRDSKEVNAVLSREAKREDSFIINAGSEKWKMKE